MAVWWTALIIALPFGGIKGSDETCGLPRGGTVGTGLAAACFVVTAAILVQA